MFCGHIKISDSVFSVLYYKLLLDNVAVPKQFNIFKKIFFLNFIVLIMKTKNLLFWGLYLFFM